MRVAARLGWIGTSLLLASCQPIGLPCSDDSECGGGGVICLPSGVCAKSCRIWAECAKPLPRCSRAGGCIPFDGCGMDSECLAGQVCDGFYCRTHCAQGGCPPGFGCQANGRCKAGAPNPAPADAGVAGCGGELFQAVRVDSNMLIVLDKSGSMNESVGSQTKWQAASAAVKSLTAQHEAKIRFGLYQFSSPTMTCDPGKQYVAVADTTAAEIAAALPASAAGNGTPVAAALERARKQPELADPGRANFIVLVTDGKENCGGNPQSAVAAAFGANIKTWVVGFGSAASVDPNRLSAMAVAGGTARNTTPRYYQADSPADLSAALGAIAAGALGCDFKLQKTPPDPTKLYVSVNGTLVPNDPSKVAGWAYDAAGNRLTLYGPACDLVTQDPASKVIIVYGCPDPTLLEDPGKGDGGTTWNWPTDGGLRLPNGTACASSADCAQGLCSSGFCGLPTGAGCGASSQCASLICSGGACQPGIN